MNVASALAIIAGVGCIVFVDLPLVNGPFVLDDQSKIRDNPEIREVGLALMKRRVGSEHASEELLYNDPSRPLVSLTFQLNYYADGTRPNGYRVVNILIHVLNAVLTHALASAIGQIILPKAQRINNGPLLAALLFLSAPLNHGTAVYCYARSDLMGGTFSLLYTLAGLHALSTRREARQSSSGSSCGF